MSSLAAATALWEFGSSGRHGVEILGANTTQSSGPSKAQELGTKGNRARTWAKSLNGKALSSRGCRVAALVG